MFGTFSEFISALKVSSDGTLCAAIQKPSALHLKAILPS
jgi:hypothetical protein